MGAVFYLGLSTVGHCSTSVRAIRLYAPASFIIDYLLLGIVVFDFVLVLVICFLVL